MGGWVDELSAYGKGRERIFPPKKKPVVGWDGNGDGEGVRRAAGVAGAAAGGRAAVVGRLGGGSGWRGERDGEAAHGGLSSSTLTVNSYLAVFAHCGGLVIKLYGNSIATCVLCSPGGTPIE